MNITYESIRAAITEEQMEAQLALENEAMEHGNKLYREMRAKGKYTQGDAGHHAIIKTLGHMVPHVRDYLDQKLGRRNDVKKFLQEAYTLYQMEAEELAFITINTVFAHMEHSTLQDLSFRITNRILDTIEYRRFKEFGEGEKKGGLCAVITDRCKSHNEEHRRKVILGAKRKLAQIEDIEIENDFKILIGKKMIELMIDSTGLVKQENLKRRRNKQKECYIVATPELDAWLDKLDKGLEWQSPYHYPTIVPPRPWTNLFEGGYWSERGGRPIPFAQTKTKEARQRLAQEDLTQIMDLVNICQNTAWKVDAWMLDVAERMKHLPYDFADIPTGEKNLPPQPVETEEMEAFKASDPEAFEVWKVSRAKAWSKFHQNKSKRRAFGQKLFVARKFVDYDRIYFPMQLDFRGRAYPIPRYLNPQGDDFTRSLLTFADGKELGEDGMYWLMIHLAGMAGVDKVSMSDRIQWVEENAHWIAKCVASPMEYTEWSDMSKPWQFLAAAREYMLAREAKEQGVPFVTHLPVQVDGSNNGSQHFAAMLKDIPSAEAVCLLPADKPADVYQIVADNMIPELEQIAKAGNQESRLLAKAWLTAGIDRKLCKTPTMTVPYGVTKRGMEDQIEDYLDKYEMKHDGMPYLSLPSGIKQRDAVVFLAKLMYKHIGRVLPSAYGAMEWMKAVVKEFTKVTNKSLIWRTPSGFTMIQDCRKRKTKRVDTFMGEVRLQLSVEQDTKTMNTVKAVSGISPNVVHSLDSSHMMLTVGECHKMGVESFSLIHDSYGTVACDIPIMNQVLRSVFCQLYSGTNMLAEFKRQVEEQSEGFEVEYPEPPAQGELDVSQVMYSPYFFA